MPHHPTSPEQRWPLQGLGLGLAHPPTTRTTLSPLFSKTQYPSLPREGTTSRQSHSDSGLTSPTPVTAPQSPINNDNEAPTPLALGSRNPFLASIIAARPTPSTGRGPTTSGMHLNRSTKTPRPRASRGMGAPMGWTLRPGPAGTTQEHARTWTTTSQSTGEHPSTSGIPPTGSSWHESMPTANRELYRTHPGH